MRKIAITTGDPDGVGPEVTVKALLRAGPIANVRFFVFRSPTSNRFFKKLENKFDRIIVSSVVEALDLDVPHGTLVEIVSDLTAPEWVVLAAKYCLTGDFAGMVTGPLSKTLISNSGFQELGHTEILARVSGQKELFQGYLGDQFQVVLATAHVPIAHVAKTLTPQLLENAIFAAHRMVRDLRGGSKPIGVLGLNPHAGEEGLIGSEEKGYLKMLTRLRRRGLPVEGPLVPDAAFVRGSRERYSAFVAAYHDQGLIPFKMVHERRGGAQVTLGLPFVRTSVDHGTAKDIAGQGKADQGSMCDAIDWCVRLSKVTNKRRDV